MTIDQIKDAVIELSEDDRLELQALLWYLSKKDDPEFLADLDRRMADMDAGKKFTRDDVLRLHQELIEQGR